MNGERSRRLSFVHFFFHLVHLISITDLVQKLSMGDCEKRRS